MCAGIGKQIAGSWKLVTAAALCCALLAPASANAAEPTGKITGTVTSGGLPLAGVEVCADVPKGVEGLFGQCGNELTNAQGEYTIENLAPGSYVIEFATPIKNVLTQFYKGKALEREAELVEVKSGETTLGIDAELQLGGKITGTVTSAATKTGVLGAEACALNSEEKLAGCALTDASGNYEIERLPTGSYTVSFFSETVLQYYHDRRSSATAEPVAVTQGQVTSGIDDEFQGFGAITGTVTVRETQAPLAGARVCADPVGEGGPSPEVCVEADEQGQYTLSHLQVGDYKIVFSSATTGTLTDETAVKLDETQTLDAALIERGKISGTVTHALSKLPIAGAFVCAGQRSEGAFTPELCELSGEAGEYTIKDLENRSYVVEFGALLPGFQVRFYKEQTLLNLAAAQEVPASEGNTTTGIDAELLGAGEELISASKAGTGSGTVTSAPAGIACGATCSALFAPTTEPVAPQIVTLTAAPAEGSTFTGWSGGGCSGTGRCEVTSEGSAEVVATFTLSKSEPPPRSRGHRGPHVTLTSDTLTVSPSGDVVLGLRCPSRETTCMGSVTLTGRAAGRGEALPLGSGSFKMQGGSVEAVTLHLSQDARRTLARDHVLKAIATIFAVDPAGATRTTFAPVTLRLQTRAGAAR